MFTCTCLNVTELREYAKIVTTHIKVCFYTNTSSEMMNCWRFMFSEVSILHLPTIVLHLWPLTSHRLLQRISFHSGLFMSRCMKTSHVSCVMTWVKTKWKVSVGLTLKLYIQIWATAYLDGKILLTRLSR